MARYTPLSIPRLERPELFGRPNSTVRFAMVLKAECDHSARVVMLPLGPGRVEVVPTQVWTAAARNRATEGHFPAE